MAKGVTAEAEFKAGVLTIQGRAAFDVAMAKKLHDGPCEIAVKQRGKPVSVKERGYLWAGVYPHLVEYFPDTDIEDVHEAMKLQFNPIEIPLPNGETLTYGGSTEDFDAGDYAAYTDRIRDWAALPVSDGGLALYIPSPRGGQA